MNKVYLLLVYLVCSSFTTMELNSKVLPRLSSLKIDVVAPASKATPEELKELKKFISLDLNIPENIVQDQIHYFLSNTDEKRIEILKYALYKDNDHIIWCLRGGYGSARIIPDLYMLPKPKRKKIFIGYSDITPLHLFLTQEWGWNPIHGAVVAELLNNKKDLSNFTGLADIIVGKVKTINITDLNPVNDLAKELPSVTGRLTGGNITLIQTSIGTKWQMQSKDKIVFFEDVGLIGYRLDRILHHLLHAGIFEGVKAIIFGEFIDGDEEINTVIKEFSKNKISIPVYRSLKFGHGNMNQPLIYNADSEIKTINKTSELIMKVD